MPPSHRSIDNPRCTGTMQVLATITDPTVVVAILTHLGAPPRVAMNGTKQSTSRFAPLQLSQKQLTRADVRFRLLRMKHGLALVALVGACGGSTPGPQQPSIAEQAEQEDCQKFLRHILELNDHRTKNMADADFAAYQANPQGHVSEACRDAEYLAYKRALPAKHIDCLVGAKTSREFDVCYEQFTIEQIANEEKAALAARKPCPSVTFAAGTATIRGTVTERGQPSEMTTVIAIESTFEGDTVEPKGGESTIGDDKGNYTFDKLRPGYYTVRFYVADNTVAKSCVAAQAATPVVLDLRL